MKYNKVKINRKTYNELLPKRKNTVFRKHEIFMNFEYEKCFLKSKHRVTTYLFLILFLPIVLLLNIQNSKQALTEFADVFLGKYDSFDTMDQKLFNQITTCNSFKRTRKTVEYERHV